MTKYRDKRLNEEAGGVSSYNDLTDKPTIPTALSSLSDDTTHRTVTDIEKTTWNTKANALGADDNYVTDLEKAKIANIINFTYFL